MLGVLSVVLMLAMLVLVPALSGFLIGGDEATAWATSVSSLVVTLGWGATLGRRNR